MSDELSPDRPPNQPPDTPPDGQQDVFAQAFEALLREQAVPGEAPASKAGPCPELGEWVRLASGDVQSSDEAALMAHAAGCGTCATRLRQGLKLLAGEASHLESEEIAGLASASQGWQTKL